jgi:homoserine kinase type II
MSSGETLGANYQSREAQVYRIAPVAVLTPIADRDAQGLLDAYGLGKLTAVEGIAGGSVNSNFALVGSAGRTFLRIYEERDVAGARRETAMLERLAGAGVRTPPPLRRRDGELVSIACGKPAALFPWLEGTIRCQKAVREADARRAGEALARVHVAGADETPETGRFELPDLLARLERIAADPRFGSFAPGLRSALRGTHAARDAALPRGLIHGDLFRDNVLWDSEGRVAALLDFESACEGTFAYDLMVTVLSWCVGDDLDPRLASAMREGYETVRPLEDREKAALHAEGCFAALRFTITRLTDYAMRDGSAGPRVVKDWRRFEMRYERLAALGSEGVRMFVGV